MEAANDYAMTHGCSFVLVETMNDKAAAFYQKLGFKIEFKRKGYAHDVVCYYLKKELE